jgi:pimeloyl-ACP methyl ester carboxylesterase
MAALLVVAALCAAFFVVWPMRVFSLGLRVKTWRLGIAQREVRLPEGRIHYLETGEGPPLVLVHGMGSQAEDWLPLIPGLAKNHLHVYAIDLLGYGRSERPNVDYSIGMEARVLEHLFEALGLVQPDVAGWSLGGWISLRIASEHPERIRRLVLLDSPGMKFELPVSPSVLNPQTPAELNAMLAVMSPRPPHIPEWLGAGIMRDRKQRNWVVARALDTMRLGQDFLDGKLARVTLPVLLVWGKQDALIPLSVAEAMRREMPQARLDVFDDCGHLAPAECSDRILPELVRFLSANPPEPAGTTLFTKPTG